MPQLFQVLKCYKCLFFQVHQTKKSNKWECKLCGEKQSIKRHYGVGAAKDCRFHVQKLNAIRSEVDDSDEISKLNGSSDEEYPRKNATNMPDQNQPLASKWSEFVEKIKDIKEPAGNECMYPGNSQVVLEVPTKKRKVAYPKAYKNINKSMTPCYSKTDDIISKSRMGRDSHTTYKFNLNKSRDFNYSGNDEVLPCSEDLKVSEHQLCTQKELFPEHKHSKSDEFIIKTKQDTMNTITDFLHNKVDKKSKWAQFAEESDDENIDIADESHIKKTDLGDQNLPLYNKVHCNTTFKDLKNNDKKPLLECSQEDYKYNIQNDIPHNLFSLCDENDLDDVLDI